MITSKNSDTSSGSDTSGTESTADTGDGVDKFHLIIPKEYGKQVRDLKGKQVRVYVDDEI
jgi:hypothetical protein